MKQWKPIKLNLKSKYRKLNKKQKTILAGFLLSVSLLIGMSFRDNRPTSNYEMAKSTVMIVRSDERSGGTGVILKSSSSESQVLTNSHVCEVVQQGGLVITDDHEKHAVTSFKRSKYSDLCILTVAANLKINTAVASSAPSSYSEASISGHPHLLPNIVTRGHFSGRVLVDIMTGIRPCTPEEASGPAGLLCMFLGGIPIITRYEAQAVSATIQPGSSGSAVYNSNGEISALVFAGTSGLGYALTMTYEEVSKFLYEEAPTLTAETPTSTFDLTTLQAKSKLKSMCKKPDFAQFYKYYCEIVEGDMLWTN